MLGTVFVLGGVTMAYDVTDYKCNSVCVCRHIMDDAITYHEYSSTYLVKK